MDTTSPKIVSTLQSKKPNGFSTNDHFYDLKMYNSFQFTVPVDNIASV